MTARKRGERGDEAIDTVDHEAAIIDENSFEAFGKEEGKGSGGRGGDLGDEAAEQRILDGRLIGDGEQGRRTSGTVLVRKPHTDAGGDRGLPPTEALEAHEDTVGDGGPLRVLLGTVHARLVPQLGLELLEPPRGHHRHPDQSDLDLRF